MARQVYVFRAKLKGWHGVRRTIAIRREATLVDLHRALQTAFDWDNQHPFAFWLSGKFWAQDGVEYVHPLALKSEPFSRGHPAIAGPRRRSAGRSIDRLGLIEGQRIAYVFDFQHEWRVRLTLRKIAADDGGRYPRVLESVGERPAQYLDHGERRAA
jgi:hypothetical protein